MEKLKDEHYVLLRPSKTIVEAKRSIEIRKKGGDKILGVWNNYYNAPDAYRILKKRFGKPTYGNDPNADSKWEYVFVDDVITGCYFRIYEKEGGMSQGFTAPFKKWKKSECEAWNKRMTEFLIELFGAGIIANDDYWMKAK